MELVDDINLETHEDAYHHEPDTAGLISRMNHVGQVGHDTLWASVGETWAMSRRLYWQMILFGSRAKKRRIYLKRERGMFKLKCLMSVVMKRAPGVETALLSKTLVLVRSAVGVLTLLA
jgi:hypothetical protein